MSFLKNLLADREYLQKKSALGIDSPELTTLHREIILKKGFLKKLYAGWYKKVLATIADIPEGKILEIGSGGGFLKMIRSDIITSDILPLLHCDLTASAEKLPFSDGELSAIVMIDTFHHLPDCEKFLKEANRTLTGGGKLVMLEPANTPWGRMVFKNLHHEPFDENADWKFPPSGPLSGANIALPWIVFQRDFDLFRKKFPQLKLLTFDYHTSVSYLLSGGLSYYSILPVWSFKLIQAVELLLSPVNKWIGMFCTIEAEKTN